MLTRRVQILLDDERHARLAAFARAQNLSVGAAIRQVLDTAIPAASAERLAAARAVVGADPMPVPAPDELRAELDALRGRRG